MAFQDTMEDIHFKNMADEEAAALISQIRLNTPASTAPKPIYIDMIEKEVHGTWHFLEASELASFLKVLHSADRVTIPGTNTKKTQDQWIVLCGLSARGRAPVIAERLPRCGPGDSLCAYSAGLSQAEMDPVEEGDGCVSQWLLPTNHFELAPVMPRSLIVVVRCSELSNTAMTTRSKEGYVDPNLEDLTEQRPDASIAFEGAQLARKLANCPTELRNKHGLWQRGWIKANCDETEVYADGTLRKEHPLYAHRNNLLYFSRLEWRCLCYSWNGRAEMGSVEKAQRETQPMPDAYRQMLFIKKEQDA